ncbi:MAG TPA: hypothetical protein DHV07_03370 [Flavobacteriales bacterium]|nr:hypothetical protein [Flavobacteriales bacterium]
MFCGFCDKLAISYNSENEDGHGTNGHDNVAAVVLNELFRLAREILWGAGGVVFGHGGRILVDS